MYCMHMRSVNTYNNEIHVEVEMHTNALTNRCDLTGSRSTPGGIAIGIPGAPGSHNIRYLSVFGSGVLLDALHYTLGPGSTPRG